MGDLEFGILCVNKSLLGKLVWHILTSKEKFWVQILSHKYLKNCSTLNFPNPTSASPCWKSIVLALEALKEGLAWNIGPLSQSIWHDAWLPEGRICDNLPYVHISDLDLTLEDIWSHGSWNLSHLATPIPDSLLVKIAQLNTINSQSHTPGWVWGSKGTNSYSSRDGYIWLLEHKIQIPYNQNWSWLWRSNIPKKIKLLIWLGALDSLPIASFLYHRGMTTSAMCPRCREDLETVSHCLLNCRESRLIWNSLMPSITPPISNFNDWVRSSLQVDEATIAAGLWWQWRLRNHQIFENEEVWSTFKVVFNARGLIQDLITSSERSQFLQNSYFSLSWLKPPNNTFKVNCDASIFYEHNRAEFGCAIRNDSGVWIKGCSVQLPLWSVRRCELFAIWRGLVLAWECGICNLICETDSRDAFLVTQSYKVNNNDDDADLATKIQDICCRKWSVKMNLVFREANAVADFLAKNEAYNNTQYIERLQPGNVLSVIVNRDFNDQHV